MKAWIVTILAAAGLAVAAASSAADITVMTQNQYLGADIAPLVAPGADFNAEVLIALRQVAANKTPERVAALAAEVAKNRPHLVGLQEVYEFNCIQFPGTPVNGCLDPSISGAFNDHLNLMLGALGGTYREVGHVTNLNIDSYDYPGIGLLPGIPVQLESGLPFLLQVRDRDVILARRDVPAQALLLPEALCPRPSGQGCNYNYVLPLEDLGLNAERGYVAATALVNGRPYVFVNTHLETREPLPFFQGAQAAQLVATLEALAPQSPPIIVVGDFNSDPNDPTVLQSPPPPYPQLPSISNPYVQMTAAGLNDAWLQRPGSVVGLSCCQLADLSNHNSQVYERIDLIWSFDRAWKVKDARVLGETVNFKTRPHGRGLWPSDHGAVTATLQFR
jgi:hypothetical protein